MEAKVVCAGQAVAFGMMKNPTHMVAYRGEVYSGADDQQAPKLVFVPLRKELQVQFWTHSQPHKRQYSVSTRLSQIDSMTVAAAENRFTITIQLKFPPRLFMTTQQGGWPRQTVIETHTSNDRSIKLLSDYPYLETGRWLAITFQCTGHRQCDGWRWLSSRFPQLPIKYGLIHHTRASSQTNFGWLKRSTTDSPPDQDLSSPLAVLSIAETQVHLPYDVLYQLEVCISHGYFREPALTYEFATKLATLEADIGIPGVVRRLLEHIADLKEWFPDPMEIFKQVSQLSRPERKIPSYCVLSQSVTVTPTTIYVHTPVVEVSNRVLRAYALHHDRFLRVKFRDEDYLGRIQSNDGNLQDNVYSRIGRALKHGITIAGRRFEFLAFGNSQLRENGAYFFASDNDLTAADIRAGLGDFSEIKVVAKYASRMGQAFSTTRAATKRVDVVEVPDITRNGYCFTDGVGVMPNYVSCMVAQDLGLPLAQEHRPSVYQFRRAGCKGILAVDPDLKGTAIHIRPSQNKFPASHSGLEICRASRFISSYLNQQLILLLSSLGVSDGVIMDRLNDQKAHLLRAMHDPVEARSLLCKSIDKQQMTMTLANMINDGFMTSSEPFLMNCLHLWLSWSIKKLREKAKILVPEGAFLFGCVDETATLTGQFGEQWSYSEDKSHLLPQIFCQVTTWDPVSLERTGYRVIDGLCLVARNPALHPGDIRVVRAVNVPQLHHLRDVVVFPQTGDRDVPNMCSGGDLDGDDYLIIWDQGLIPKEWNHEPMDYTPPMPRIHHGVIGIEDIAAFFVEYMKYDNLGMIATNHRFIADYQDQGVKYPACLELSALHSTAVDFAKTGVPAVMGGHLRPSMFPAWANKRNVRPERIYNNGKILHQIYETKAVDFEIDQQHIFDRRVLDAFVPCEEHLESARALKTQYDADVNRLMSKYGIETEFEVWTTFVLSHNEEIKDYNLAETLGTEMNAVKQQYREQAFEEVGTTEHERDMTKLAPYIVAMYTITAEASSFASEQGQRAALVSFPWVFQRELGQIARFGPQEQSIAAVPALTNTSTTAEPVTSTTAGLGNALPAIAIRQVFETSTLRFQGVSEESLVRAGIVISRASMKPQAGDVPPEQTATAMRKDELDTGGIQLWS